MATDADAARAEAIRSPPSPRGRRAWDWSCASRRARDQCRMDYGCFRIESKDGVPVVGTYPYPYSLTLDAAAEAIEQLLESPPELGRDERRATLIHGRAGAADPDWGS